jgi:hypothetical protein
LPPFFVDLCITQESPIMIDLDSHISFLDRKLHSQLYDISSDPTYVVYYWSEQMEALEWVLEGVYEE